MIPDELTRKKILELQTVISNQEIEINRLREECAKRYSAWGVTKDLGKRARYILMSDDETMFTTQTEHGQRPMYRSEVGKCLVGLAADEEVFICRVVPVKRVRVSSYRKNTRDGMIFRYLRRKFQKRFERQSVDTSGQSEV